eukprot:99007-Hanusia_phi.AAC.6
MEQHPRPAGARRARDDRADNAGPPRAPVSHAPSLAPCATICASPSQVPQLTALSFAGSG